MTDAGGEIRLAQARCRAFAMDVTAWRVRDGLSAYRAAEAAGGLSIGIFSYDIEAIEKGLQDPLFIRQEWLDRIRAAAGALPTVDPLLDQCPAELRGLAAAGPSPAFSSRSAGEDHPILGHHVVEVGLDEKSPGRVVLTIVTRDHPGLLGSGNLHLHPDFADQLAIDLIRLAATARAFLPVKGS